MRICLLLILTGITTCTLKAQQNGGEVIFQVQKTVEQPQKGFYFYKQIDYNLPTRSDTTNSVYIQMKGDTLCYYRMERPVARGKGYAGDPKFMPFARYLNLNDETGTHLTWNYFNNTWDENPLYSSDAKPNRPVAIVGFFAGIADRTHDNTTLLSRNTRIEIDTVSYSCIALLSRDQIRTLVDGPGLPIALANGKKIRLSLGTRKQKQTVFTIYYLRKSDLLPIEVIEYAPVKNPTFDDRNATRQRAWVLYKAME